MQEFGVRDISKEFVTANGRGSTQPLENQNGEYSPEQSRRVEFLFRLKDDEAIQAIDELVNQ